MSQIEQARYKIAEWRENVEVRDYATSVMAEVEVTGTRQEATAQGVRLMTEYFGGNNFSKKIIPMGVPVMLQNGTKTLNSTSRSHWKIQAVIPSQYTRETLPRPNSSKIKFINVPAHRCAVMRFSGLAGDRVVKKYTHQLLSCVENNKLKLRGDPVFCFYNYSWTLPFMRRNEVMVNLDAHGINASMSYKPVVHSTLSAPKLKKRTKMKTESAKKVKYAADGTIIVEHKTVEAMALSKSAGAKPKAKTAKKKVAKKASAVKAKAKKTTASKAKAAPKKVAAKKTVAKKTVAKKTTAKKAVAKKVTVKKVVAKKTKKVAAKKTTSAVKKSVAKKSMAKKPAVKKSVSKKKVASKSLTLSKALKSKKTLHKKAAPKAHKKIVAKKTKLASVMSSKKPRETKQPRLY